MIDGEQAGHGTRRRRRRPPSRPPRRRPWRCWRRGDTALLLTHWRQHRRLDLRAETLERHYASDHFQRIALRGNRRKPPLRIEKSKLPHRPRTANFAVTTQICKKSRSSLFFEVPCIRSHLAVSRFVRPSAHGSRSSRRKEPIQELRRRRAFDTPPCYASPFRIRTISSCQTIGGLAIAALPNPAMNSRRRIVAPSRWLRGAYRGDGFKGTGSPSCFAALHEAASGPTRPSGISSGMSASWGGADADRGTVFSSLP